MPTEAAVEHDPHSHPGLEQRHAPTDRARGDRQRRAGGRRVPAAGQGRSGNSGCPHRHASPQQRRQHQRRRLASRCPPASDQKPDHQCVCPRQGQGEAAARQGRRAVLAWVRRRQEAEHRSAQHPVEQLGVVGRNDQRVRGRSVAGLTCDPDRVAADILERRVKHAQGVRVMDRGRVASGFNDRIGEFPFRMREVVVAASKMRRGVSIPRCFGKKYICL